MASKPFQFKKFTVSQEQTTHKVGTDAVLLGAWVQIWQNERSILDIGTGSGVLALMMAQRTPPETHIDAVEIEARDAQQARENFSNSSWSRRISLHHLAVQDFEPGKQYDLVVSNPPYFVNSLTPPDPNRSRARHAQQLSFADLLQSVSRLLKKTGRFALILPYIEGLHFVRLAQQHELFPVRKTTFRTRPHKPAERILLEFAYEGRAQPDSEIILYTEEETWSSEYKGLTDEFYTRIR